MQQVVAVLVPDELQVIGGQVRLEEEDEETEEERRSLLAKEPVAAFSLLLEFAKR